MSATDDAIESLITDLRRTLWLGQLQRGTRAALWAWALIMTAGAILHALIGRPGASTTLGLGAAAWVVALAATVRRRPTRGAAALYADRRLGGQSALGTWLETAAHGSDRPPTSARSRLVEWVAAAVPTIRSAMRKQRSTWRLARPAAAALTCTALAAAVMMLGGARPASTPEHDASSTPHRAATESPRLDETALADAIATELAARTNSADATGSRDERGQPREGNGAAPTARGDSEVVAADSTATLRRESSGASTVPATDREAGDTRDDSTPGASSRAAAGPLLVHRRDLSGSTDTSQRLANDERVASYEDVEARVDGAPASIGDRAAAARAPAARGESQLSPSEVAYVADWQSGRQPANKEQR